MRQLRFAILLITVSALPACSRNLFQGTVNLPNYDQLNSIRRGLFALSGPKSQLVLPNPIDAASDPYIAITDPRVSSLSVVSTLPNLLIPSRLESEFIKMRIHSINDALSSLAAPDASGNFTYSADTDHYSESLGYYSLSLIQTYIEALGFSLNKNRPLYVFVLAPSESGTSADVNAFYDHHKFDPSSSHTMSFYGDTSYKVSKDRDMFFHEFGHFVNESVSAERGIDFAGDRGANYTEGAALHECLADYGAETLSGHPYIGRWIARNFSEFQPGQPLRSAQDTGPVMQFAEVSTNDNRSLPERYAVAEWCTRVLWRIRSQFVLQDSYRGPIDADRLIYSAISLLPQDASFTAFRSALLSADQKLGGVHSRTIEAAFAVGGFDPNPSRLRQPLSVIGRAEVARGGSVNFNLQVSNPNGNVARNVRVILEQVDARIVPVISVQGFGDMPAGATVTVSSQSASAITATVSATGGALFRLRVVTENGNDGIYEGAL
ncbi:MAG: hypothetical protein HYZ71_08815 [Deltaproteobacteria bacterium]|nr:hypothetical protein [Deltaproteobacteria bacterium]